jgi:tungstate transport system substrate-binding protein
MLFIRSSHRPVRAGAHSGHGAGLRRLIAPLAAVAAAVMLFTPSLASADSSSTLTVVGTSDLSDSGLIQHVIQPAFNAAYPQFTFKYIGTATGTAITDAETGSVGASALIVHAASLENQFVAGGYSYEQYGRALWTNDFVLAGPTADPAGVAANGANNIAQAFADVAAAGIAGKAEFISRGGTPGTTVEEHGIWALVASSNLEPAGLILCAVSAANGGGETPIAASAGVANGQPCPNGGALPTNSQLPSWYAATGLTQGPNVVAANACNGYASGANSCYVLTDRGTYDYLASGTDSAGTISNLTVATQNDSATAPGGQYELVNYFHGYIINPAKTGQTVNLTAAQDFLNLITSPPIQTAVAQYLNTSTGGAPFTPSASPLITTKKKLPAKYTASAPLTITGTVANAQVGYPALDAVKVTLDRVAGDLTLPVASAKTNTSGVFTIRATLPSKGSYVLSTPQFGQIENSTLNPVYGDILSPAQTSATSIAVRGAVSALHATSLGGRALVTGAVGPSSGHVSGKVTVYARWLGAGHATYRKLTGLRLASSDGRFAAVVGLKPGRWQIKTFFSDKGTVQTSAARTTTVTVGAAATAHIAGAGGSVSKSGALTTHVRISPKAAKGAKVSLVVVKLSAAGAPARSTLDSVKVKTGARTVTLHGKLTGSGHWAVLESYKAPGVGTAWARTVGHVTIKPKTKTKTK